MEEDKPNKKVKKDPHWILETFIAATPGQPAKYSTPEELKQKITKYFINCYSYGRFKPTVSGLTFYLGFKHRQSLADQCDRGPEYSDIIGQAKQFIINCYESLVYDGNSVASWILPNMDPENFKNKTEIVNTNSNPLESFDLTNLSDEELQFLKNLISRQNTGGGMPS